MSMSYTENDRMQQVITLTLVNFVINAEKKKEV